MDSEEIAEVIGDLLAAYVAYQGERQKEYYHRDEDVCKRLAQTWDRFCDKARKQASRYGS